MKHIFHEKKHKTNQFLQCGSISFGKVVIKDDEKIPDSTRASYQEVLSGEFLINPLNLNYDLISLRIALSYIDVVVSPGYIIIRNITELNRQYFKFLLHRYDVAYMKLLGSGVRQTISFNHIADSLLILPTLTEQTRIAEFLDRKTAQIDQAIAQKERLIELLNERRQVMIHQAVTRGLNPDVPMKDSGIEWIGEIPAHWEVAKAKFYSRVFVPERAKPELSSEKSGTPWVTTSLLRKNEISLSDIEYYVSDIAIKDTGSRVLKSGSVIASCVGTFGLSTKINFDCIINQQLQGYMDIRINSNYFNLLINISESYFTTSATLTTIAYVNKETFGDLPILLPFTNEQEEIVKFIKVKSDKYEKAIDLKRVEIEKLKELKSTLINSAVTGKIKV